jgi:hypothetical protein
MKANPAPFRFSDLSEAGFVYLKTAVFCLLGLVLLLLQWMAVRYQWTMGWYALVSVGFVHSVMMIGDCICELLGLESPERSMAGFFLPVGRRGLPQLIKLLFLLGAVAASVQIQRWAEQIGAGLP